MAYQDVILYYFTGTGNSFRAACWMAETSCEQGAEAQVISIEDAQPQRELRAGQLVGLFCPTHGFTAPWAMIRFALTLPKCEGLDAFVVLTRAGVLVGKRLIQGLEGSGAYLLSLILMLKGYRVRGVMGLDMPGAWTAVAPGFSKPVAEAILARVKPRALAFFSAILGGQRKYKGLVELAVGLVLLPLSLAYLLMGRFMLAKLFYATNACNGCGLCAQACPLKAVRMRGGKPYWTLLCESCTRCMNYCPKRAVEASYPFAALLMYLSGLPAAAVLLDLLARRFTAASGWHGPMLEWIIAYPYKLLAFAVTYLVFWLVMRIPLVNSFVTFFTPTRFYRRYHEPGTHLGEIATKRFLNR